MPANPDDMGIAKLLEGDQDAVVVGDAETGRIVYWNRAAAQLFGHGEAEAVGRPMRDIFPEGVEHGVTPDGRHRHLTARRRSGERLELDARVLRLDTAAGRHVMILPDRVPVLESAFCKRLEEELLRSEERYRALYDDNPHMYFTVNRNQRILSVNRFGAEYLGYEPEELVGKNLDVLFPEGDREIVDRQVSLSVAQMGVPIRWEVRKRCKDGTAIWVRDVSRAVYGPEGDVVILLVCEDITEQRRTEAELQAQHERLKELDRLKSQFVSSVSHELRTPLTCIRGYVEFLEDEVEGPLNAGQRAYVEFIRDGSTRLQAMVDDLLDFSRLEAGTFRLRPEPMVLAAKVREVAGSLKPLAEAEGVRIAIEAPEDGVALVADPLRIGQVVMNLLENAIKFSPRGGLVTLQIRGEADMARVEVVDEGPGVAPEDQARIFERFVQLEVGEGQVKRGTGLGLAIAKGIVEAHGGHIGVTSEEAKGSRFWFTLPKLAPA